MREFHREITIPSLVLILGLMGAFTLLGGCTTVPSNKIPTVVKSMKQDLSRCKIVGKSVDKYSTVLVRKDCLRPGVTEVTIVLHVHKDKYFKSLRRKELLKMATKGMEEAYHSMIRLLGFKPKLASMGIVRMGNVPCYLFVVIGVSN